MAFRFLLPISCLTVSLSDPQMLYDTSLQFHTLNIPYPMKTYAGIGAIYNNTLYGFNGMYCETNNTSSCDLLTQDIQHTLNISSIKIHNTSNKLFFTEKSPSWIVNRIGGTHTKAFHLGSGTSSSTYLNQYAYTLHPGCCTEPTGVALKYNLISTTYINQTTYHSNIPGENLSDSCNTNDGTYIYSIGGRNGKLLSVSKKVVRYDILFNKWEELSDLNIPRFGASCTFVQNTLYVLGGGGKRIGSKLNTIEIYINQQWDIFDDAMLHTGRNQHISITHPNNWIVTVGGIDQNNEAAITELFDPLTGTIVVTEAIYSRKQFFHAVYEYDINTRVLFVFGGNFNHIVYDDVQYMVLSKVDQFVSEYSSTMFPSESEINNVNKSLWKISETTLVTILICVGGLLLIICIIILVFMIFTKKNRKKQESRIYSPPRDNNNNCFIPGDCGSIKNGGEDEETQEMNRLVKFKRLKHNNNVNMIDSDSSEEDDTSGITSTTDTYTTATNTTNTNYKGYSKILKPR